jgi:hypothetical protein
MTFHRLPTLTAAPSSTVCRSRGRLVGPLGSTALSRPNSHLDQLIQIIQTSTEPSVIGVRVHEVELLSFQAGTCAFVVTIPRSNTCHQAPDQRFHRRDNSTSRIMHRDEILDVLNRATGPDLRAELSLDGHRSISIQSGRHHEYYEPLALTVSLWNESPWPAEHVAIRLFLDARIRTSCSGRLCRHRSNCETRNSNKPECRFCGTREIWREYTKFNSTFGLRF